MFDLETLRWERLEQSVDEDVPQARYFHSADACEYLVNCVSLSSWFHVIFSCRVRLHMPVQPNMHVPSCYEHPHSFLFPSNVSWLT